MGYRSLLGLLTGLTMWLLLHAFIETRHGQNYFVSLSSESRRTGEVLVFGLICFGLLFMAINFIAALISAAFRSDLIFLTTYLVTVFAAGIQVPLGSRDGWLILFVFLGTVIGAAVGLMLGLSIFGLLTIGHRMSQRKQTS